MSHFTVLVIGEDVEKQLAPFQENCGFDMPQEYLVFNEDSECDVDKKTGKRGYWQNPNAKWDWYQIGGRWSGMLKLKPGATGKLGERGVGNEAKKIPERFVDQARIGDIDWRGMRDQVRADRMEMWPEFKKAWIENPGTARWMYGFRESDEMPTREEFINAREEFSTHAVLKHGKWFEKGEMGWFAVVHGEKAKANWLGEIRALLSDLPPDTLLTIVDCHI